MLAQCILFTFKIFISLFYVINYVNSYWPSYGSKVSCIGSGVRANTADQGPVTGPTQIHSFFVK